MIEQHQPPSQSIAGPPRRLLLDLRERRFQSLPLDCGRREGAGIVDVDEWRDWTVFETTPDQLRIEDYLDRFDLGGKRILHIGIGNSGLATRFAARAKEIVGTTVIDAELRQAISLRIGNYHPILHNKHASSSPAGLRAGFDFVVDNNPTTFCCCLSHLETMLRFYEAVLAPDGQIVTDRVGLGWTTDAPGSNPRWAFSFEDLAECASLVGLRTWRIDRYIYVLSRGEPARPPLARRIAHSARASIRGLARIRRRCRRLFER